MKAGKFVKVAIKITGSLVLTVLLFYLSEYLMRVLDPATKFPNGRVGNVIYTWGYPVSLNKFGFRERDFDVPKPAGIYRIMVLGDSFVFGTGLPVEERFTNVLEKKLNIAFPTRKFEVLSFGIEGLCTKSERDILSKYAPVVKPDLVVVGYVSNDVQCESLSQQRIPFVDYWLMSSLSHAFTNTKLDYWALLFRQSFLNLETTLGREPSWTDLFSKAYNVQSGSWADFLNTLGDIKKISDHLGLPTPILAVLDHSHYSNRRNDYTNPDEAIAVYLKAVRQAEAAAVGLGFTAYNYEKEIISEFPDGRFALNQFDNHPPAKLHEIYAEKLLSILTEKYLK